MKFHERFNIEIGLNQARERFVNRVYNEIFWGFLLSERFDSNSKYFINRSVSTHLGDQFQNTALVNIVGRDFLRNLHAIEGLFANIPAVYRKQLDQIVLEILDTSEVDLGIQWNNGKFLPSGAKSLDESLVNDNLQWLRDQRYSTVLEPFEKGLRHLLDSASRSELSSDVITDMYEALEALAKVVTGKDKDLSANQEMFLSQLNVSDPYRKLLRQYIEFGNEFRHAAALGKQKLKITFKEAESFTYLTGMIIRLSITDRNTGDSGTR